METGFEQFSSFKPSLYICQGYPHEGQDHVSFVHPCPYTCLATRNSNEVPGAILFRLECLDPEVNIREVNKVASWVAQG